MLSPSHRGRTARYCRGQLLHVQHCSSLQDGSCRGPGPGVCDVPRGRRRDAFLRGTRPLTEGSRHQHQRNALYEGHNCKLRMCLLLSITLNL